MSNHRIKYEAISSLPPQRHRAVCSCRGWASAVVSTRQLAEDEALIHLRNVEKARAAMGTSTPSLKSQQAWYQQQAENPNNSPEDRRLWQLLANELGLRLGLGQRASEDVEIPFD